MNKQLRVVDLFSGCGGLSLGFHIYKGSLSYKTVMALDNHEAAVRVFNDNIEKHPESKIDPGRIGDMTWFGHSSEILLYYLVHYSLSNPDKELFNVLVSGHNSLLNFFAALKKADIDYNVEISNLVSTDDYKKALSGLPAEAHTLAMYKTFIYKMGISSIKQGTINDQSIPWKEEYSLLSSKIKSIASKGERQFKVINEVKENVNALWDLEVEKLESASKKEGKGQQKDVAKRVQSLVQFLKGENGEKFKAIWLEWKSRRDSIRAEYCLNMHEQLQQLYLDNRQVDLMLGGPPCKGFSRIGRAVINNLKKQGAYAWFSRDYGDERNALLHKYVLFLEALKPRVFIFENVSNFQSELKTSNGTLNATEVLAKDIEDLSLNQLHYEIESKILNASDFAIPQKRERFIMVGFNIEYTKKGLIKQFFDLEKYNEKIPLKIALQGLEEPAIFSPTHKVNHLSKTYKFSDENMPKPYQIFIDWITQPNTGELISNPFTDAHIVRQLREDDEVVLNKFGSGQRWMDYRVKHSETFQEFQELIIQLKRYIDENDKIDLPPTILELTKSLDKKANEAFLLRLLIEESSRSLDKKNHLLSDSYISKGTYGDWFERLSAEKPSKTIVAHIGKDTYGYFHPFSNRALSIREAARIQSFPDFFKFGKVGVVDAYTMIGNAVPPLLANIFAEQLEQFEKKYKIFCDSKEKEITLII
ncbi:Modification methylase BspRI [compost metagenome]